jgi:flagellar biosynthesis/type III secretory pathway M-ring protein FliF/YscJ
MNYLRNTWAKVRVVLVSLPPSQRYTVVALVGLVVVALALLVTGKPAEEFVTSMPVSTADMSAVSTALKGTGIKYQVSTADGELRFPSADEMSKAQMVLSEKNALPKDVSAGFSFDDLVKPKGFSLETAEEYQTKRSLALGTWIAKAVSAWPVVKSAQVQISTDQDGYWGPKKATAAVGIVPRVAESLPDTVLAGMCRFVAAAAGPTLRPQDVVITNLVTGQTFSMEDQNSSYGKASNLLEYKKSCEKYYKDQVQDFLGRTWGVVQTAVTVKTDMTSKKTVETEYTPTQQTSRNTTSSSGAAPGGEEGTKPNAATSIVTAQANAPNGPSDKTTEKESTSSPSKEVSTEAPPGEIVDVQLGVIVSQDRLESIIRSKDDLKAGDKIDPARAKKELDDWQGILLSALSVSPDGQQKLSQVTFSAAPTITSEQIAAAAQTPAMPTGTRVYGVVMDNWQRIALLALSLVALLMIRSIAKRGAQQQIEVARIEQAAEEEAMLPEPEVDVEQKRANKMRESVEEMIRHDPQSAVALIRRWVARET